MMPRNRELLDAEACGASDGGNGEKLDPQLNNDYLECCWNDRLSDDDTAESSGDAGYARLAANTRPRPRCEVSADITAKQYALKVLDTSCEE